jgi:MG2 domain/Macroglobulin domain MG3
MRIPLAALAVVVCVSARAQIAVDEPGTRAHLVNGRTAVTLALDSRRERPVQALIELQWLGLADQQHGLARVSVIVVPGHSSVEIPMPLSDKVADPLLDRLRYQLDPAESNLTAFGSVRGALSFIYIANYAFSLRVIAPTLAQPGKNYELRVLTLHPLSGRPINGVNVECGKSTATSDENGLAVLRVAANLDDPETPLTVKARLGDLSRKQNAPQIGFARSQVRIQSDKPIYQPGQTMYVRILAMAADGKAQAGAEHTIKIFNESEDVEHAAMLTTSRFGVASTDWEIPANAKAGEYRIQVDADDEDADFSNIRMVNIQRYELPSFRVNVHLDRPYYLPRQTATINIRGDYLFGKPVNAGKVLITEDGGGTRVGEGELNAAGQFQTTLNVGDQRFNDARFVDRHFTAFVTDRSTNRTEQRKFDLRISRDSLHVYVAREESTPNGQRIYVTTYSPDGAPAPSDVAVLAGNRVLATGRTNRFGLTRLDFQGAKGEFLVRAVTNDGRRAEQTQTLYATDNGIWLDTDRTLYPTGEVTNAGSPRRRRT